MRTVLKCSLLLVLAYYALCAVALIGLRFLHPPFTAVQLQRRVESLLSSDGSSRQRYVFVPASRISGHLLHAVIAAEDTRFHEHHGVDWKEMQQAMRDNERRGRLWRGGSTLTQQLVKNLFLTTRLPLLRKPIEMSLALLAEALLPKQRILELYVNVVEWGPGVFGAEAAARYHYGISAAELTREQAARLAACLPAPRKRRPERMPHYAGVIMKRMARLGW
jgi:monofunctional biosynthetic peptidoglycan transglycosylase